MPMLPDNADVVVIAAGPAGAVTANLLVQAGVEVFKPYVRNWDTGMLPIIVSADYQPQPIRAMLTSTLVGYVWHLKTRILAAPVNL